MFPSKRLRFEPGRWFHNFVLLMDKLEALPKAFWIALAMLMAAAATLSWDKARATVFSVTALAMAGEAWILMRSQRTMISPSPLAGPFSLYSSTHAIMAAVIGLIPLPFPIRMALHITIQAGLFGAMAYGTLIEPFKVGLREERVKLRGGGGETLRIFMLSDLHLDRRCSRVEQVMEYARAFKPDLVLWPGDFTNLSFVDDAVTKELTREVLQELGALAPVYVSRGTPEVDDPDWVRSLVEGTEAVLLDDASAEVKVKGRALHLMGVPFSGLWMKEEGRIERLMDKADGKPAILLHHSPDMIERAAELKVDLYVAGHTHGGQIRMPVLGGLITASVYGDRFSGGTYRVDGTTLVVSRGVGLEGGGAPRMRFLCPPEVIGILVELPPE